MGRGEFLIIHGPPLLRTGDALALSTVVDGLVLVARAGQVRRHALDELPRTLDQLPAKPLGVVVTGLREGRRRRAPEPTPPPRRAPKSRVFTASGKRGGR
jgi:Mrp family chromosome partitioning ATPase